MAIANNHYCVIMAGGGNRFWPVTREDLPKPFMATATNGKTFIQNAFDRFAQIVPPEHILVVTSERYRPLAEEQLPLLRRENLLIEPYSRGTAPCIAFAAGVLLHRDPSAVMIATPADCIIRDEDKFRSAIVPALEYASANPVLMTVGLVPDHPDPNYGYIQKAGGKGNKTIPMKVKTFTEKPSPELAEIFCRSGEFYWNTGIYIWQAAVIREEMTAHLPRVAQLFKGWIEQVGTPGEQAFIERTFMDCDNISIDYGVMEKTSRAMLYPADFSWIDFDNWCSLYDSTPLKDASRNHIVQTQEGKLKQVDDATSPTLLAEENEGCIFYEKQAGKLLAIKGLKDFVVVDTDDVLLICPRDEKILRELPTRLAQSRYDKFR